MQLTNPRAWLDSMPRLFEALRRGALLADQVAFGLALISLAEH